MASMTYEERSRIMVEQYGESCTKVAAGRIMGCDPRTISRWIADGRIEDACCGTRVDVRSLARYLSAKKQVDEELRKRKVSMRYNCEFVV